MAASFMRTVISAYRFVVSKLTCPSHPRITLTSTPASRRCTAVLCRLLRIRNRRHSFAVHRLVAWYRQGADVQLLLPKLSTYLGHISLAETQHYLPMTPDLLREAARRFETYAGVEVQP